MARATFYYEIKDRAYKYEQIEKDIRRVYNQNEGIYGYRRVYIDLKKKGIGICENTVCRLMHDMGLKAKSTKKSPRYNSFKGRVGRIADNVIKRDFDADAPNKKWFTDVSQMVVGGQKCYLSPLMDSWNGEIISYALTDRPTFAMIQSMLRGAFHKCPNTNGIILHSDQGWHYQIPRYQLIMKKHHIVQSMSRKGNCLDNSMMENFFALMKKELLYVNEFDSMDEFKDRLRKYIHYYNHKRIKLRLGMSPIEYRKMYEQNNNINN